MLYWQIPRSANSPFVTVQTVFVREWWKNPPFKVKALHSLVLSKSTAVFYSQREKVINHPVNIQNDVSS